MQIDPVEQSSEKTIRHLIRKKVDHDRSVLAGFEMVLMLHAFEITLHLHITEGIRSLHIRDLHFQ